MSKKDVLSEATKRVPNRFLLIRALSKRVDQLRRKENSSENFQSSFFNTALKEIAEGTITLEPQEKNKT